jgi:hypothetical protein
LGRKLNEALKSCGDFKCKSPASLSERGAEASVQTTSAEGKTLGDADITAIAFRGHCSKPRREPTGFDAVCVNAEGLGTPGQPLLTEPAATPVPNHAYALAAPAGQVRTIAISSV